MNYRYLDWLYYTNTFLVGMVITLLFSGDLPSLPAGLQLLGRAHLMLLHFPIVLFFVTAFLEIFSSNRNSTFQKDSLLLLFSCATSTTALAGLLLSKEGGSGTEEIGNHQWLGIGMMVSTYSWFLLRHMLRSKKWLNVAWIIGSMILVILVGHEGASLTHGSGFLAEPLQKEFADDKVPSDPNIYTDIVQPILEKKCTQCHNSNKSKGGLDLSTTTGIQKGGKNGKLFDPLQPAHSLLVERLLLPLSAKEHMPPSSKPQLEASEMLLLQRWIHAGMPLDMLYSKLKPQDSLAIACTPFISKESNIYPTLPEVDPSEITAVNTNYCSVTPIANEVNALRATFFSSSQFNSNQLEQLLPVKAQLVTLNLSRMPVSDNEIMILKQFTALRTLNLSFTKIKGSTLGTLVALEHLGELSLAGCPLSPESIGQIASLKQLKKIFLWNSGFSTEHIAQLRKKLPSTNILTGFEGNDKIIQLPPPVISNEKTVFADRTSVAVKHVMQGVTIRYTLDGSEPDSVNAQIFPQKGVSIDKSAIFKARAFMAGWMGSATTTKRFFKNTIKADSITLLSPPNPQYAAKGNTSIQDGKTGTTNFRAPNWLGFREKPFYATVFFLDKQEIHEVILSSLNDVGSYIVPPARISIKYRSDNGKWVSCYEFKPAFNDATPKNETTIYNCKLPAITCKELLIEVVPVAVLPNWHPGKGDRGWFFIDEVFIN